jgi:hypothetical protein
MRFLAQTAHQSHTAATLRPGNCSVAGPRPEIHTDRGWHANATVVDGVARTQQTSGPHKSTNKGRVPTEPAAPSEAARV